MNKNLKTACRRAAQGAWMLACASMMAVPGAKAQDYPTREIHMINGYSAGAGADIASRIFGKHLEETLGKPVIIENRPGAFTNIGAGVVAHAEPDGYTLMFSGHTAIATNIHLFKTLPFDPVKDFVAVAPGGNIGFGFAVGPQSSVKTMAELTAYLKTKGSKATYGYANAFGLAATELYKNIAGVSPLAVPYKNSGDALNDLARGELDLLVYDLGVLTQQEGSGRLRVLAVTTADPSTLRPDLPGMREAGIPDYDLRAWFGIWAPAKTPASIVDKLWRATTEIWNKEDKKKGLAAQTIEPFIATPEEFEKFIVIERAKWGRVAEIAKMEKQ
jgi:tripartite-type tricarboxylate transporter receptor subunit TctC